MPWTVHLPVDGGYRAADLEHPAALPRIGERVEYINETGKRQLYRVIEVIHTLQSAADTRPLVSDGGGSPNATPRLGQAPEVPGGDGLVRAGLPRVYLAIDLEEHTMNEANDEGRRTDLDAGAYIGREPELASETIPGGVRPEDERVSAGASQSGTAGEPDAPSGHAESAEGAGEDVRAAGQNR